MKIFKNVSINLIGFALILLTTLDASAQSNSFDIGFLAGLSAATHILEQSPSGYGPVDYHTRIFEIRRDSANIIANNLAHEAQEVSDPMLKLSLEEIYNDIKSVPKTSYGDVYYWVEIERQQERIYDRAAAKIEKLDQFVTEGKAITTAREVGYLKGLRIAMKAMAKHRGGYGDIDYHKITFELRREMANSVAKGVLEDLNLIQNLRLRSELLEMTKDISAAPQRGYGDIFYWVEMQNQQDRIFSRLEQRLDSMIEAGETSIAHKQALALKRRQKLELKKFTQVLSTSSSPDQIRSYLRLIDLTQVDRASWSDLLNRTSRGQFIRTLDVVLGEVSQAPQSTRAAFLEPLRDVLAANDFLFQTYNGMRSKLGFPMVTAAEAGWPPPSKNLCERLLI